ncbi:deacylase [Aequorivita sp. H23M31]|uniref:Deacylase n=1 Tax=Aequorivita ciconiae TaxID=2494375 RepID=A0A410G1S8_9FLAO|nr:acyloxyacyl hydrolase [Aequorivita sp. H23M31]QAA81200.1 deacylase [Aequorivita sp. H23M31]
MKNLTIVFFLFLCGLTMGQNEGEWKNSAFTFTPEILFGKTMEGNEGFPSTRFQKQIVLSFGRYHTNDPQQWAQQLKGPKTGISMGVTDFGNLDTLGLAFSVLPFIEFKVFGNERLTFQTAMGASYSTKKHDPETNPQNNVVTTDLTWAFRSYFYYMFLRGDNIDWRLGLGYSHHSNGHMRLLNIGFNSFLVSLSADIKNPLKYPENENAILPNYNQTVYDYFAFRGGFGQNVLGVAINDRQNVYTIAGEYGRVYNNTYKVGIGFYARLYEHYHNYIIDNESLVQTGREFEYFKDNPLYYASNLGISIHGEVFLNHIGIDLQLGYNIYKPAYKLDYRINEGWENTPREIPTDWVLGDLNFKYKIKHRISSRIGLKYYLIGMENSPKNNFYLGAHLSANLGQADFSELSFGYVYNFNFRER